MLSSITAKATRSLLFQRQVLSTSSRRVAAQSYSTSIFQKSTLTSKLPQLTLSGETTLGELWTKGFVTYKYRAVYPLLLWVAFLYSYLWFPYATKAEREEAKEREELLQSLAFKQAD